ncbi:MAG: RidA family protein [Saprospiraceae bacterium]|nr:RidA family protein [Saprospiraceae bacterium]
MHKETINPPALFNSTQYGFSQVVITNPGRLVFISGQVAWDEQMQIVGEGDLEAQTQKAFDNLRVALESAGGTLQDIVMLRIYKVDYQNEDGPVIASLLRDHFGTHSPPASTWVSVQGLANDQFLIEIEAQAVIPAL